MERIKKATWLVEAAVKIEVWENPRLNERKIKIV